MTVFLEQRCTCPSLPNFSDNTFLVILLTSASPMVDSLGLSYSLRTRAWLFLNCFAISTPTHGPAHALICPDEPISRLFWFHCSEVHPKTSIHQAALRYFSASSGMRDESGEQQHRLQILKGIPSEFDRTSIPNVLQAGYNPLIHLLLLRPRTNVGNYSRMTPSIWRGFTWILSVSFPVSTSELLLNSLIFLLVLGALAIVSVPDNFILQISNFLFLLSFPLVFWNFL